jgi:DNA-directed RNA polymerase subunit M/transcription elongation factor TFIIS
MNFCDVCDNMLYIKHDGMRILHMCMCCHKEFSDILKDKTVRVSRKVINESSQSVTIDQDTFSDPTLPVVDTIPCNNKKCDKPPRVAYIRYDHVNMKYMYKCRNCGETWDSKNVLHV